MVTSVFRWVLAAVRVAGWAPLAVFLVHVIASRLLGTYRSFPPLDAPMHLVGGLAIAFFFWRAVHLPEARFTVGEMAPGAATLLCLASVGTATVVWEFAEWISDRFFGTSAQLGLEDTLLDMFLGIVGGLVFVWLAAAGTSRRTGAEARRDAGAF